MYHAEALLTVDGALRLYVGGPASVVSIDSGAGISADLLDPAESALFVGHLDMNPIAGAGKGVVIGQVCAVADTGRFCGGPSPADISVQKITLSGNPNYVGLAGEMRIATSEGVETWLLDVSAWSIYYNFPARLSGRGSMYKERLAQFAQSGDVIVTIDPTGRMFFQSPDSGCTGNGTLAPHLDGAFRVFDVTLSIEGCNAGYASLNGAFEGLATESQDNYWGWDTWLVMFLSTPDAAASKAAVTLLGSYL